LKPHRSKVRFGLLLCSLLVGMLPGRALAIPGQLDTSFSGDGLKVVDAGTGTFAPGQAIARSRGKLVVTGVTDHGGDRDVYVARLRRGGRLDKSFGTDGFAFLDFFNLDDDMLNGLAVLDDGRIVVAGWGQKLAGDRAVVARLTANGDPDPSFGGGDGRSVIELGKRETYAYDLAVLDNGKILVSGEAISDSADRILLVRLKPNGDLDPGFGTGGTVLANVAGGSSFQGASRIGVTKDGGIVVAGSIGTSNDSDSLVARFLSDGQFDDTFSTDGVRIVDLAPGDDDFASGLVAFGNGKVAISASDPSTQSDFVLARFLENGKLDTTFDEDGIVRQDFEGQAEEASDLIREADGKLIVAGFHMHEDTSTMATARFTTTGAPDTGYGTGGLALADFGGLGHGGFASNACIAQGARIAIVGSTHVDTSTLAGVARFLP
jgi:uncharacterized delta-60 repeat protein